MTHDSFAIPKQVKAAFEDESGLKLKILQGGDAGETVQPRAPDQGQPTGRRPVRDRQQPALARARRRAVRAVSSRRASTGSTTRTGSTPTDRVTPIDHGDVCLNVDSSWFASRGHRAAASARRPDAARATASCSSSRIPPPRRRGSRSCSPRWPASAKSGWQDYWRRLRANGVLVVDGWEEAYTSQFSGAGGSKGKRPIVVSYATSPAAEVIFAKTPPADRPDRGGRRQLLPPDRARRRARRRQERGGRPGADRLHALASASRPTCPRACSCSRFARAPRFPAAFRQYAVVAGRTRWSSPRRRSAHNRDRWIDEWTQTVLR